MSAVKASAGLLREVESQELDKRSHTGSVLAVLQSKARRLLKNIPSTNE
jgi:hypothetical protein